MGRKAAGMWLPECAFHPDLDAEIAAAGIGFTLVDSHGVADARPRPIHGVHAPICSPSGVASPACARPSDPAVRAAAPAPSPARSIDLLPGWRGVGRKLSIGKNTLPSFRPR